MEKIDILDQKGNIVGYCDNFRLNENGYTICDIHITDVTYNATTNIKTVDLWEKSNTSSPIIRKDFKNALIQIHRNIVDFSQKSSEGKTLESYDEPLIIEVKNNG